MIPMHNNLEFYNRVQQGDMILNTEEALYGMVLEKIKSNNELRIVVDFIDDVWAEGEFRDDFDNLVILRSNPFNFNEINKDDWVWLSSKVKPKLSAWFRVDKVLRPPEHPKDGLQLTSGMCCYTDKWLFYNQPPGE